MNPTSALLLSVVAAILAGSQALAQTCQEGNPRVAPDSRYARSEPVPGERVVTDTLTGLVWKECVEGRTGAGCGTGWGAVMTWASALATAEDSHWAGYSDWRLPNINELSSLVETGCHSPSINTGLFPRITVDSVVWSSTTHPLNAPIARAINFELGLHGSIDKNGHYEVRLVRGGQGLDAFDAAILFADGFEGQGAGPRRQ